MSQPAQLLNPSEVIGRRWVIDVPVPRPHKRYLHVTGGPTWMSGGWCYWLDGADGAMGGPFVAESTLQRAMAEGVEIPPGADPLDYVCSECREVFHPSYVGNNQIGAALRERSLCFMDDFWFKAHADYLAGARLVVSGQSYSIASERAAGSRGHGGRCFRIQYPDGRVVESTNVWTQGSIPERWRDRMPDTAIFLPDEPSPGREFKYEGHLRREVVRR